MDLTCYRRDTGAPQTGLGADECVTVAAIHFSPEKSPTVKTEPREDSGYGRHVGRYVIDDRSAYTEAVQSVEDSGMGSTDETTTDVSGVSRHNHAHQSSVNADADPIPNTSTDLTSDAAETDPFTEEIVVCNRPQLEPDDMIFISHASSKRTGEDDQPVIVVAAVEQTSHTTPNTAITVDSNFPTISSLLSSNLNVISSSNISGNLSGISSNNMSAVSCSNASAISSSISCGKNVRNTGSHVRSNAMERRVGIEPPNPIPFSTDTGVPVASCIPSIETRCSSIVGESVELEKIDRHANGKAGDCAGEKGTVKDSDVDKQKWTQQSCCICHKVFDTWPALVKHLPNHSQYANPFKYNARDSESESKLTSSPLDICFGAELDCYSLYSCSNCPLSFRRKAARDSHQKLCVERLKAKICCLCGCQFLSEYSLDRHIQATHLPTYDCNSCKQSFESPKTLGLHKKSPCKVRSGGKNPGSVREKQKNFNPRSLTVAIRNFDCKKSRQRTARPFVCCTCGSRFRERSLLIFHSKMHQITPHECKARPEKVEVPHVKNPEPTKKYVCPYCDLFFKRKVIRDEHQLKCSVWKTKKGFQCNYCGDSYTDLILLNNHMCTHLDQVDVMCCTFCGISVGQSHNLKQHINSHHRNHQRKPTDITSKQPKKKKLKTENVIETNHSVEVPSKQPEKKRDESRSENEANRSVVVAVSSEIPRTYLKKRPKCVSILKRNYTTPNYTTDATDIDINGNIQCISADIDTRDPRDEEIISYAQNVVLPVANNDSVPTSSGGHLDNHSTDQSEMSDMEVITSNDKVEDHRNVTECIRGFMFNTSGENFQTLVHAIISEHFDQPTCAEEAAEDEQDIENSNHNMELDSMKALESDKGNKNNILYSCTVCDRTFSGKLDRNNHVRWCMGRNTNSQATISSPDEQPEDTSTPSTGKWKQKEHYAESGTTSAQSVEFEQETNKAPADIGSLRSPYSNRSTDEVVKHQPTTFENGDKTSTEAINDQEMLVTGTVDETIPRFGDTIDNDTLVFATAADQEGELQVDSEHSDDCMYNQGREEPHEWTSHASPDSQLVTCTTCGAKLKDKILLFFHSRIHHETRQQHESGDTSKYVQSESADTCLAQVGSGSQKRKRQYPCTICNMEFTEKTSRDKHRPKCRATIRQEQHNCHLCDRSFSALRFLKLHITMLHKASSIANDGSSIVTDDNTHTTTPSSQLAVELSVECTQRRYKCHECSMTYRRKAARDNHYHTCHVVTYYNISPRKKRGSYNGQTSEKKEGIYSVANVGQNVQNRTKTLEENNSIAKVQQNGQGRITAECESSLEKFSRQFVCDICKAGFRERTLLVVHSKTHQKCHLKVPSVDSPNHLKEADGGDKNKAETSAENTKEVQHGEGTESVVSNDNIADNPATVRYLRERPVCDICQRTFTKPIYLQQHLIVHQKHKKTKQSSHRKTDNGVEKVKVKSGCHGKSHKTGRKTFTELKELQQKKSKKCATVKYDCDICDSKLTMVESFNLHLTKHQDITGGKRSPCLEPGEIPNYTSLPTRTIDEQPTIDKSVENPKQAVEKSPTFGLLPVAKTPAGNKSGTTSTPSVKAKKTKITSKKATPSGQKTTKALSKGMNWEISATGMKAKNTSSQQIKSAHLKCKIGKPNAGDKCKTCSSVKSPSSTVAHVNVDTSAPTAQKSLNSPASSPKVVDKNVEEGFVETHNGSIQTTELEAENEVNRNHASSGAENLSDTNTPDESSSGDFTCGACDCKFADLSQLSVHLLQHQQQISAQLMACYPRVREMGSSRQNTPISQQTNVLADGDNTSSEEPMSDYLCFGCGEFSHISHAHVCQIETNPKRHTETSGQYDFQVLQCPSRQAQIAGYPQQSVDNPRLQTNHFLHAPTVTMVTEMTYDPVVSEAGPSRGGTYHCSLCKAAFRRRAGLEGHEKECLRRCMGNIATLHRYQCEYCGEVFRYGHRLKAHLHTHTGTSQEERHTSSDVNIV